MILQYSFSHTELHFRLHLQLAGSQSSTHTFEHLKGETACVQTQFIQRKRESSKIRFRI